jgi:hypothetical protein
LLNVGMLLRLGSLGSYRIQALLSLNVLCAIQFETALSGFEAI